MSDRSSRILAPAAGEPVTLRFEDNALVQALCGQHDQHLARIEQQLGVHLVPRGNEILVTGPGDAPAAAEATLNALYARLQRGLEVGPAEVDAALRMAPGGGTIAEYNSEELAIRTRRHSITPRSPNQAAYIRALRSVDLVFAYGPAGTGKTYLAVAVAVAMLLDGEIDRIILSRPAVEAGERLGFLPGDLREKVDPYLRPLYDALHDMLPPQRVAKSLQSGEIEIAPLAFMRGRTLANAFVILDEGQNATPLQIKMFLTRLGENSRMAVTGDISQVDLPPGQRSGMAAAMQILSGVEGVRVMRFTDTDVVRHPLVTRIVRAYDAAEAEQRAKPGGESDPPGDATPGTADDGP